MIAQTTKIVPLTVILAISSNLCTPTELPANTFSPELFNPIFVAQSKRRRIILKLPPIDAPGSRQGGAASRGECPNVETQLTALIPPTHTGLSASNSPTFWFYNPYTIPAEFILMDERRNEVYRTTVSFTEEGIISIQLPQNMTLNDGRRYRWTFSVICNPNSRVDDILVSGEVKLQLPNSEMQRQLATTTEERDRLLIYAANGYWFDTLTTLGKQRLKEPDNHELLADWNELLGEEKIRLNDISSKSLLGEAQRKN
ncbi:DUF928 domain-containing protein [Microcoleus sp. OTE_8_concoct_300]|uniref:DUF928 domain-containing protein n=1 Tax=Microcoleus sp. OTE_8_concoct_300 TaxID=2964710 RepID=UPI00403FB889